MRLVEKVAIAAPAEVIWPYVADPVLVSVWNPKIVAVEREREGVVVEGERYGIAYRMTRDVRAEVTVARCEPPTLVVLRNEMVEPPGVVIETLELRPGTGGTHLSQSIDLSRAGIPLPVRALMWLIHRFGRPADPDEPRYLEILRDLIEEEHRASAAA